jgi:hypothetical protein
MATDFILQCFEQWKHARHELDKATKERLRAQAIENTWYKTAQGLQQALEAAKERGEAVPDLSTSTPLHKAAPELPFDETVATTPSEPGIGNTEFVRRAIMRSAGITPAGIRKMAREEGRKIGPNFPHTILWKLKKGSESIFEKNGKYYPTNSS